MLDVFKSLKEYDTIFFVPHENEEDEEDNSKVKIDIAQYKEAGEKLDGSDMGDMFDIIIFRMNEEYDIIDLDRFEGILIDPRVYVSRMVNSDWYGMVSRKTTTSKKMVDDVFDYWKEMCYTND